MADFFNDIMSQFSVPTQMENYGNGHINDTYLSKSHNYILQKINTDIFKDPKGLMDNIEKVTSFLKKKIVQKGGDPERETLTVIKTKDGNNYYECSAGCFRMYKYIDDALTIEKIESCEDMYRAGKGFGKFQALLDDYPAGTLNETIPDFHNTSKRFKDLEAAIKANKFNRVSGVQKEIDFCFERASITDKITKEINGGTIPVRVTHNDTKINNILFDIKTREAICVIDLDTVMPGSALYDFGDALRIGASTALEDEKDLDKVHFNVEYFTAFAKGYLEETTKLLSKKEVELLPFSAKLLTFECGMRFLTDHLNGDTYFKIHRKNHNLDRARNQFKLVKEIESKEKELDEIIGRIYKNFI